MGNTTGLRWKYLIVLASMLFVLPLVTAVSLGTGLSPLDGGIRLISSVFNIDSLRDTWVQTGFLKFMLFLVMFAISNAGLKKVKGIFDNKVAGIVSFAFSAIGTFLMPEAWLLASGATITAIMSSFVFILVFIGGGVLAVYVLRKKGDNDDAGWVKNLAGLLLVFLLIFLINVWASFTHLTPEMTSGGLAVSAGGSSESMVMSYYGALVSWTYLFLTICLIVKIVQFFTGGSLLPGGGSARDGATPAERAAREARGTVGGPRPPRVQNFRGIMNVPAEQVDLEWDGLPETVRYEIDRRPTGPSLEPSRMRRAGYNLTRTFIGGWRRAGEVPGDQNTFNDSGSMTVRRWLRPTYTHNTRILPTQAYEYRIRAVNNHGNAGEWTHTIVRPQGPPNPVNVQITAPANDAPDHNARREVNDATPMIIAGVVTGPQPQYDYIWGIYDDNTHQLVSNITPATGSVNIPSGTILPININCAALPDTGTFLPVGNYSIFLWSQTSTGATGPFAPPADHRNPGPNINGSAQRHIMITSITIVVPFSRPRAHPSPRMFHFGRQIPFIHANIARRNRQSSFRIAQHIGPANESQVFHVFFFSVTARHILTTAQLAAHGIQVVSINFNRIPVNYHDNFVHQHPVNTRTSITIQYNIIPVPAGPPQSVVAFITTQMGTGLHPNQAVIDQAIINYSIGYAGGGAPAIPPQGIGDSGVRDFNWLMITHL